MQKLRVVGRWSWWWWRRGGGGGGGGGRGGGGGGGGVGDGGVIDRSSLRATYYHSFEIFSKKIKFLRKNQENKVGEKENSFFLFQ